MPPTQCCSMIADFFAVNVYIYRFPQQNYAYKHAYRSTYIHLFLVFVQGGARCHTMSIFACSLHTKLPHMYIFSIKSLYLSSLKFTSVCMYVVVYTNLHCCCCQLSIISSQQSAEGICINVYINFKYVHMYICMQRCVFALTAGL